MHQTAMVLLATKHERIDSMSLRLVMNKKHICFNRETHCAPSICLLKTQDYLAKKVKAN